MKFHLASAYTSRQLDSFSRDEFQKLLNEKAADYSYSVVAHLRWTLRQIFGSPQEFGWPRILGGFPENHKFGPGRGHSLSLQQ